MFEDILKKFDSNFKLVYADLHELSYATSATFTIPEK